MLDMKIIPKEDVPRAKARGTPDWVFALLDKLESLPDGTALQITMPNRKEAKGLIVRLLYFRNKRNREYNANMPLSKYVFTQRQQFVFIYKKQGE